MSHIIAFVFLFSLLLVGCSPLVFAQKSDDQASSNVPEKNGDYADPDHPGVRVRVFVHEPKNRFSTSSAPVCSNPDSNSVVGPAGWHLPAATVSAWTYNLNSNSVPSSVGGSLATIAGNGFNQWASAVSASAFKPNIVQGGDTNVNRSAYDGLNVIAWGRTQGTALAVTYIRYYTDSGLVVDVDTIMNKKFPWSWSGSNGLACGDPNSYDAQDILTHEEGHWMGLNDEYAANFADNTMFGYGSKGEVKKDTLTTGDTQGVQAIYH